MATLEAALSLFAPHLSSSSKSLSSSRPSSLLSINLHQPDSFPLFSQNFPLSSLTNNPPTTRKLCFERCFSVQQLSTETETSLKRKLYVLNLPWSFSVADIKNLFGQCGTVKDVEIIRHKNGRSRGFAFVTMASGEVAQAVVNKFDFHEVSGRIIRVEYSKRFRKPSPTPPPSIPPRETRHKLYVSNLAWKVRASHLREFFSTSFNPLSSKVVFNNPTERSAGYGFVSFATKEEAEAAISSLDGKELMGRPLRLKFCEKKDDDQPGTEKQELETFAGQPEE